MVYTINQRIITLKEYGVENFRSELLRLKNENSVYNKKNQDWFDYLPDRIDRYLEWFFLFDDNEPVAFSTIQEYYPGCYRILTRSYIYRKYRRFTNPKYNDKNNPTMMMRILPYQLNFLNNYDTIFVSMQDLKNRKTLDIFKDRISDYTNLKWQMDPNMLLTCDQDWGSTCWQNIIYHGEHPKLQSITTDEWKQRYE